jgi:hypothetical protein
VDAQHFFIIWEQAYRYNNRTGGGAERFVKAVKSVTGKRLTHEELISKNSTRVTLKDSS